MTIATLLGELEHEARARSNSLEATAKLPNGFTAKHYPLTRHEQAELQRHKTAMLLADGPYTFLAILREGKVPRDWYGRRLREVMRG